MPERPLISLVTPSLNQGRFLAATIESVLAQGYPALEYFIQDGGSTDETPEVLARYRGRVPSVVEPDQGQADAINRGLRRARGEILGYLNSDDLLLPGALEAVAAVFEGDPEARLVYGRATYVGDGGEPLGPYLTRPDAATRLRQFCCVAQPAAFFRRPVWEEVGELDASLHHAFDYDYWLRIAARYRGDQLQYVDRELAAACAHEGAKTVASWERAFDETFQVARRHTGGVSLWLCLARWDRKLSGCDPVLARHRIPLGACPPALAEFLRQNPPHLWGRAAGELGRALRRRLGSG